MNVFVSYLCWAVLCSTVWVSTCYTLQDDDEHEGLLRSRREAPAVPSTGNARAHCQPGDPWPAVRVNTTQRLFDLRNVMREIHVDAFVIYTGDAHGSEYPADSDKRRAFISGFTGTAGWVAVTMTKAAFWTDSRYTQEADWMLDCNWIRWEAGRSGNMGIGEWLVSELTANQTVGVDPFLVTKREWERLEKGLQGSNVTLTAVPRNPVDDVWTDQPHPAKRPINAWNITYAGKTWQDKVRDVHKAMEDKELTGAYIITLLDETAWLFNLRGSDVQYNPFFMSYAVLEYYGNSSANNKISLYIYDKATQLTREPTDPATTDKLYVHLNTNRDGTCTGKTGMCVQVLEYDGSAVVAHVSRLVAQSADHKFWIDGSFCNFAIYHAIPEGQRFEPDPSYIAYTKTMKNPTEVQGMQMCNNRDAAVMVEFFAWLEREIADGKHWTELSAGDRLAQMRNQSVNSRGISFETIAGSGPNAAIIHYTPKPATDRRLVPEEMFLLDSGGQYLECTTDTTRTVHFGTPTAFEKEAYTRVLMGNIDLARAVWTEGTTGVPLELLARQNLWRGGLDYLHGSGHGIGAYLAIHDGPVYIGGASRASSGQVLRPFMFLSDEPGYYEDGKFGVRLETVLMVEPATTKHQFGRRRYLHWKPVALVPFEPKLIDYSLMSNHQIEWLNSYHQRTQETIEPLLTSDLARTWMRDRTRPYVTPTTATASPRPLPTLTPIVLGIAGVVTFQLLRRL